MEPRKPPNSAAKTLRPSNAQAFLESAGVAKTIVQFARGKAIFTQEDACEHVTCIQSGAVKLSVLSKNAREARSSRCLAQATSSARAVWRVSRSAWRAHMVRLLHMQHAMSDRFIAHMLARNIRVEQDLVDQFLSSSEKRLPRALLLLARYGSQDKPMRVAPKILQETPAEMIGTTRSRVHVFLNTFKKLGLLEYDGQHPLKLNGSLPRVILHE